MDAVLLARIQFAMTVGFHYIFPPLTFGVGLLIVIFLGMYLKTKDKMYDTLASFWTKIFLIIFTIGVATGIVMEFQFGTNWEKYSRFVGDIFGAPLAAEGLFAFFLESTFLGVLIFGKKKVSEKFYFFSALMVLIGSVISGFWIIVANSWQQTPAGFHIVNGRAELTSFYEAIFNPSTWERFFHAIMGGFITGSFFIAALSSYMLLKKKHIEFATKSLTIALVVAFVTSILQLGIGHAHAIQVAETQPAKLAALEAHFETKTNAGLSVFGIPNVEEKKIDYNIEIPGLLSYLIAFDTEHEVKGLNDFPEDELPPIHLTFFAYRIMVGLGTLFIFAPILGLWFARKKVLTEKRWYLYGMLSMLVLPTLANQFGWIAAEVGRQPWIVYGYLKTKDAISSVVSASEILFSLILFGLLYVALFAIFVFLVKKKVDKGPALVENKE